MTPADSLQDLHKLLLFLEQAPPKSTNCKSCGQLMSHADADFWVAGSAMAWKVSIPVCTSCDSTLLNRINQAPHAE
jgi:hypothetical protein